MSEYNINSIKSLSFREGVRERVQMYLGSDDLEGVYQAFKEILNNSTDEALAGYGNSIDINLNEEKNEITVTDYGRGVPFGIRDNGENVLESIYTKAHTGGKFDDNAYKNASGLNGIGGSCVCLTSDYFIVISSREGKQATANFENGIMTSYKEEPCDSKIHGTKIIFSPSSKVFKNGDIHYDIERLSQSIKDISYLYNGIKFNIFKNGALINTFCAKNGILDFVKDNVEKGINKHIIGGKAEDEEDSVEIAFQWGANYETSYVFVNGLCCPEGGSPITGAKTSITKVFNNLAGTNFSGEAIRNNLFYVINCKVKNPSFANQTKTKINNANLRTLAANAFTNAIKDMYATYPDEFNKVANMLKAIDKADKAAERARKQALESSKEIEKNIKRKVIKSDKLKDAEYLGKDATLLIVEGDSASGAVSKARDYRNFGILGVRGKMINALSREEDRIFENEEIKLLLSALGIVPNKYDSSKLRYGKVGICVDADADGGHIALLIMAALQKLAPQFIKEGRLCWLHGPLYIVTNGKEESYYYSDEEYNKVRGNVKGEITRAKGLGALSPEQMHNSMFNPKNQRLETLEYDPEAIDLLYSLMGNDADYRKNYIFENIDFSMIRE